MAHLRDGASVTVMLGETKHAPIPEGSAGTAWDASLRVVTNPGGANFAMADGSTRMISDSIDIARYREFGKRKKAFPVSGIE